MDAQNAMHAHDRTMQSPDKCSRLATQQDCPCQAQTPSATACQMGNTATRRRSTVQTGRMHTWPNAMSSACLIHSSGQIKLAAHTITMTREEVLQHSTPDLGTRVHSQQPHATHYPPAHQQRLHSAGGTATHQLRVWGRGE